MAGWALFDTPMGACALAWHDAALTGCWLPDAQPERLAERVQRWRPGVPEAAPSALAEAAIDGVRALLNGDRRDLRELPLDWADAPAFEVRVWQAARDIPPGETRTYGELAAQLGEPGAARAVGRALGRNPFAPIVPCHRILAAGGASGGFSAPGGLVTKLRLLEIEGSRFGREPSLFD